MKKTLISTVIGAAFRESAKLSTIDRLRMPEKGVASGHQVFTTFGAQNAFEAMNRIDSLLKYNVGHATPWPGGSGRRHS